ncbi:MAG TPA: UDP-N-acetylmuramoyl-tripeptide--D-alanyl-D-alanine ligase [Polyangia bacterium]|nr:UDP-N-acetylmuramoyl-tripeptide--D-alanyl-D-alanine ligase [Polyangia bacterium]
MAAPAIPLSRLLESTGGSLLRGSADTFSGAGIDSRAVKPGALFFAVKGDRFDGHDFVAQAVRDGARGVVVARGRGAALETADAAVVEVDDVVAALGALARAHRLAMGNLRVVAVTGSNGKTTTKELLGAILVSATGQDAVLKTEGNLNNHLGVPLTLLQLTSQHRYAVVEMGMSGLGEIAYLTELARPDVAVITNIAGVHLEQLGSLENVARAKAEIFGGLGERGIGVYPAKEPLLSALITLPAARRRTFGPGGGGATVTYDDVQVGPKGLTLKLRIESAAAVLELAAQLPLIGRHNASNAAAAVAASLALGIGEGAILDGLGRAKPAKHRAQLVAVGADKDRTILDDCYNAAPPSMKAALDALVEITPAGAQKVAVLGDMLELGADSAKLHAEIGAYASTRVDQLITIGPNARAIDAAARPALGARAWHTDDPLAAAARVRELWRAGDVILVKASRGMRLERVIDALTEAH